MLPIHCDYQLLTLCCLSRCIGSCFLLCIVNSKIAALVVDGFSCERAAACSGRNEICASCSYGTYAQCAAACLSESTCVSFEWASEGGAYPLTCHLSTSCMAGVSGYYGPGESYSNWNLCVRTQPGKDHLTPIFMLINTLRLIVSFALIIVVLVPSRLSIIGSFMCGHG